MKRFKIALVLLVVLGWIGSAGAVPMLNLDASNNPINTFANGTSYGTYMNSGTLLFVESGNNFGSPTRLSQIEGLVREEICADEYFKLTMTNNVTFTPLKARTGTWETTPPAGAISFYVVKAGNAFAMYRVDDPVNDGSTGSWSTFDIWGSGSGTGGKGGLSISHFTGYNPTPSTSVPEPATMLLFGAGAIIFGGYIRRKRIKS